MNTYSNSTELYDIKEEQHQGKIHINSFPGHAGRPGKVGGSQAKGGDAIDLKIADIMTERLEIKQTFISAGGERMMFEAYSKQTDTPDWLRQKTNPKVVDFTVDIKDKTAYLNRMDASGNRGYGTETMKAVLSALKEKGIKEFTGYIEKGNSASQGMMRKAGASITKSTKDGDYWSIKNNMVNTKMTISIQSFPGHAGRPGQVGGSVAKGTTGSVDWQSGKTIALGNLTETDQKIVNDTISEIVNKYPGLKESFHGVYTSPRDFSNTAKEVAYFEEFGSLHFNPKYNEVIPRLKKEDLLPQDAGLKYVVAHEMGHVAYYHFKADGNTGLKDLYRAVNKDYTVKPLTENTRNQRELFADTFAHHILKKEMPNEYTAVLKSIIGDKMQNNMEIYAALNEHYTVREEQHQGKTHLVVPVIMMREGVHNGSHGQIFHPIDELGHFEGAWNGIPVSIQHPSVDGKHVSANAPDIIDSNVVGRVFNTHVEGDKLRAEAWLDKERLKQISPATAAYLQKGQPVEVSLGMFTDDEAGDGNWNGEAYTATARNHRPDHLALLPGGKGACSWEDGCGIRVNSEYKEENIMSEEIKPCCPEKVEMLIQDENSRFTEDDRDWLLTQSAEVIEKLQPVIIEKEVERIVVNTETPTKEAAIQVLQETFADPQKFMALLPTAIRDQLESGLQLHQEKRNQTIPSILSNQAGNAWTKEELAEMHTVMLTKIANSLPIKRDFSGQSMGASIQALAATEEKLLPPGVTIQ